MAREIRNSRSGSENKDRENLSGRKSHRRGKENESFHPKVNGIKSVKRIKDDEEKLLTRRPRIEQPDEERGSRRRTGTRTFGEKKYPPREPRFRGSSERGENRGRTGRKPYSEDRYPSSEPRFRGSSEGGENRGRTGRKPYSEDRYPSREPRFRGSSEGGENRGRTGRKSYGDDKFQSREPRFRGSSEGREPRSRTGRKPYNDDSYQQREPRFKGSSERGENRGRAGRKPYGDDKFPSRERRVRGSGEGRETRSSSGRKSEGDRNFRSPRYDEKRPAPAGKKSYRKKDDFEHEEPGLIRLNRFIANAGICSRREADEYIQAGAVSVNGKIVTELGTKVLLDDEVVFEGQKLVAEKKVYLLLNKPKNYVTTTDDPHAEKNVMELIEGACSEHIYPVGRLDRNSTGLLLFTNDGEMAKRLSHPSHINKKIYQVSLDKPLTKKDFQQIAEGVELEDGLIAADEINYIDQEDRTEIGIEIHSGKNRVVRRIFEQLGYTVKKLDRVYYAGLTKKNLPRGKWRFLTPREIDFLKMK